MNGIDLSPEAKKVLKEYADGRCNAASAAWELWQKKLTPVDDVSAADVIFWCKECGYGIPDLSEEETAEQVKRALNLIRN
jgi:hypothetical protein